MEYFIKAQKLNWQQARWALYLSRFDFTLKHILGTKIGKANGLSRRPDWKVGIENDNSDQTLIKEQWICSLAEVIIKGPKVEIIEKIKRARSKNKEVIRVVEEMKKAEVKILQENKWQIEEDLVLKERKVYVLKDKELRAKIIWLYYDVLVAGHEGRWKTTELVTKNYWWPGITRDIGRYIKECDMCQRMKNRTEEIAGKLKLNEVLEKL